ncbi:MAG: L-histidine N(alpha)-methyltransferase, partial [Limisphaerales bacterium]
RTDPDCAQTYERAFEAAAACVGGDKVDLIGLGCGGGQKDSRMLACLRRRGKGGCYLACDVSPAMVLEARRTALDMLPHLDCRPLVCDLGRTENLAATIEEILAGTSKAAIDLRAPGSDVSRLFTFFGMIPNFESEAILPRLAEALRPTDFLLLSANLAPGPDYHGGVETVLPLYDNPMSRDWLMTFLVDLGIERDDGELIFTIEADPNAAELLRIAANFRFRRSRQIAVDSQSIEFCAGETVLLFFSCRHTPALMRALLGRHRLGVLGEWVARSGEEGVFLVAREQ